MTEPDLSIIIPVFRMRTRLARMIEDLHHAFAHLYVETILVDDSGNTETHEYLRGIQQGNVNIVLVRMIRNMGQHQATLCGMSVSRGRFVMTIDDDYRFTLESITGLVSVAMGPSDYDVIYGVCGPTGIYDMFRNAFFSFVKIFSTLPNNPPRNGSSVRIFRGALARQITELEYPVVFLDAMQLNYAKRFIYMEIKETGTHHLEVSNYKFWHSFAFLWSLIITYTFIPQLILAALGILLIGILFYVPVSLSAKISFALIWTALAVGFTTYKVRAISYTCKELIQSVNDTEMQ